MATAYDEIQYVSFPYHQSHPDRLASIAKLLGLEPPAVETARVLELGCASGNNLIPMAENLPKGSFLGIDYSEPQIARGKALVAELGLKNMELRHGKIEDVGPKDGLFDYIIVHGIYSWVPLEVQTKILEVCKKNLKPDGVAYVSYNVLPGWRMRGMIRDMMLYHIKRFNTPQQKLQQARALLEFLVQSVPQDNNAFGSFLKSELELLRQQSDNYLFHDHLEENNTPCYFHEFIEKAGSQGLRYLGDADMRTMATHDLHAEAKKLLTTSPNQIESEQYMDFLRNRMFRMTLLVHADKQPVLQVNTKRIRDFYVASLLRVKDNGPVLNSTDPETYTVPTGGEATAREPLVKAAMRVMAEAWPERIQFNRLAVLASEKLGLQVPTDEPGLNRITDQIGSALLLFYTGLPMGSLELSLRPLAVTKIVTDKPKVNPLTRKQSGVDGMLTNLRHQTIRIGDFEKFVLPHLDGKKTKAEILEILKDLVQKQHLQIRENNILVVDPVKVKTILEAQYNQVMLVLGHNSLLVA
ncbi:MAG: methyltransferase domain-containing protein [Gemmataceae bacterium]|nr:methyltransferase domain-containing protein [Gemmataceae bacterium]